MFLNIFYLFSTINSFEVKIRWRNLRRFDKLREQTQRYQ